MGYSTRARAVARIFRNECNVMIIKALPIAYSNLNISKQTLKIQAKSPAQVNKRMNNFRKQTINMNKNDQIFHA